MVKAMRERIIEWGGEVRFGSKVTDLFIENDRIIGVEVNGSERIDTTVVLSGVGIVHVTHMKCSINAMWK